MGQALHTLGIDTMSVEERIVLVQDIWDSVAVDAGLLPPNALEQAELERRRTEDEAAPGDTVAWETVKTEARSRWQR